MKWFLHTDGTKSDFLNEFEYNFNAKLQHWEQHPQKHNYYFSTDEDKWGVLLRLRSVAKIYTKLSSNSSELQFRISQELSKEKHSVIRTTSTNFELSSWKGIVGIASICNCMNAMKHRSFLHLQDKKRNTNSGCFSSSIIVWNLIVCRWNWFVLQMFYRGNSCSVIFIHSDCDHRF